MDSQSYLSLPQYIVKKYQSRTESKASQGKLYSGIIAVGWETFVHNWAPFQIQEQVGIYSEGGRCHWIYGY